MNKLKPFHQLLLITIPLAAFIIWAFITGLRENAPMILVIGMMTLIGLIYVDYLILHKIKIKYEIGKALICPSCGRHASLNYVLIRRELNSESVTDIVMSQCKFCSYRSLPFQISFPLTSEHKNFDNLPFQQRMLINKTSYEEWFYKITGIRR